MCELNKIARNDASHISGHIVAVNKICSAERRNLPITAQDIQSAMVDATCILSVLNKNPKISVTPPCKQQIDRAINLQKSLSDKDLRDMKMDILES